MKSLNEVLKDNRNKSVELMLSNNISHISITDNSEYGRLTDAPCVILDNHNGEYYETEVTDIKLSEGDIYIKVVNTTDLSSSVSMDKEGYINSINCLSYSNNEVYCAIEFYCVNLLYFNDKIRQFGKEIEQKIIELLNDEDEKSFTFKDCDMYYISLGTREIGVKRVYLKEGRVVLETSSDSETFLFNGMYLEEKCNLYKQFVECLENEC